MTALLKSLLLAVVTLLALTVPRPGWGQIEMTDLGTLGGYSVLPLAMNSNGQIVGFSKFRGTEYEIDHAFLWEAGTMYDLGAISGSSGCCAQAMDINDAGWVVGMAGLTLGDGTYIWDRLSPLRSLPLDYVIGINSAGVVLGFRYAWDRYEGFTWDAVADTERLLSYAQVYPIAINDAGQIIGQDEMDGALLWEKSGWPVTMPTLGGRGNSPAAINRYGTVVGKSRIPGPPPEDPENPVDGDWHAYVWRSGYGITDLGSRYGGSSRALAINDVGQVVGADSPFTNPYKREHAFYWDSNLGWIDLATPGELHSIAYDINNAGQVVGLIRAGDQHANAFLWERGRGMMDLGHLGGSSWAEAHRINDAGQIMGTYRTPEGQTRGFVATVSLGYTPPNGHVVVQPVDPSPVIPGNTTPVTVAFDSVTGGGVTSVTSAATGTPPPGGFKLGGSATYYSVSTTAGYEGAVQVCLSYPEGIYNEPSLRLMHWRDAAACPGGESGWEDVTDLSTPGRPNPDTVKNVICGTVTCLSEFVIVEPLRVTGPAAPVAVNTEVTVSALYGEEDHALWDFGDGTTARGQLTDGSMWTGTHAYVEPGIYTVALTLFGTSGAEIGSAEYRYIVVYDPSAGFVTGGGRFDSPAGAFTADPTLTGKATFGFVSKYLKGATRPTGSTEFQLRSAGLNFHSESYDWLLVAGAKAQFKGSGTVKGEGQYRFLLTAIDADVNTNDDFALDRFRIKIWRSADGLVVYDNALGRDADTATTTIAGGAIVIHAPGK